MSQVTHQHVCPNCNYETNENYCAHCGQEVHLHDDTLRGLILHFAGHYFHYESKMWQTVKTLWFKPGGLTIAYLQRQRARYLSPISLYIFVSAVFFITAFLFPDAELAKHGPAPVAETSTHVQASAESHPQGFVARVREKAKERDLLLKSDDPERDKLLAELMHKAPKVFFFMLPFMALLLSLFFIARPDTPIVHHAIFSLHIHAFAFCILTLLNLNPFDVLIIPLGIGIALGGIIYFMAALRNVYAIEWGRAAMTAVSICIIYLGSLVAIMRGLFIYVL